MSIKRVVSNIMTTKKRQITISEFFGKDTSTVKSKKKQKKTVTKDEGSIIVESVDRKSKENVNINGNEDVNFKEEEKLILESIDNKFSQKISPTLEELLKLEKNTIDPTWFLQLETEFIKPYFIKLKNFLKNETMKHSVFPKKEDIYSWSRLTPFDKVKVVIIGQDPYHNINQAHGLAFSVLKPTPAPPSLKNIYKEIKNNYSDFIIDNKIGDLSKWAKQGVLLLNTSLTVRAHNANSHSKEGWQLFTHKVVEKLIEDRERTGNKICFLLWGNNAIKLVENIMKNKKTNNKEDIIKIFKSVHPSPLSASRGFFGNNHFKLINEWLIEDNHNMIDWSVVDGNSLNEVVKINAKREKR